MHCRNGIFMNTKRHIRNVHCNIGFKIARTMAKMSIYYEIDK